MGERSSKALYLAELNFPSGLYRFALDETDVPNPVLITPNDTCPNSEPDWITGTESNVTPTIIAPAACTFSLSSYGATYTSEFQDGIFSVTTGDACPWDPYTDSHWITLVQPQNPGEHYSIGSGLVFFNVDQNVGSSTRVGRIHVETETYTVTQQAACAFSVSPGYLHFPSNGGTDSLLVDANYESCFWSGAVRVGSWIGLTMTGAYGDQTVYVTAQDNSPRDFGGFSTIASVGFNRVVGVNTKFRSEACVGYGITIEGQDRIITEIINDRNLSVDTPFSIGSSPPWGYTLHSHGEARIGQLYIAGRLIPVAQDPFISIDLGRRVIISAFPVIEIPTPTPDGVTTTFTFTNSWDQDLMVFLRNGIVQKKVASSPGAGEYSISKPRVIMGTPPFDEDNLLGIYWVLQE